MEGGPVTAAEIKTHSTHGLIPHQHIIILSKELQVYRHRKCEFLPQKETRIEMIETVRKFTN